MSCLDQLFKKKTRLISSLRSLQRFSGVAGVIVIWLDIGICMQRIGLGFIDDRPLSYLGVDPSTATLFTVTLLVSAALFTSFAFYLQRTTKVGQRFMTYFLAGQLAQAIVAVVSYAESNPLRPVHTITAFGLAFSLPLFMRQFTKAQQNSPHYRTYLGLLCLEQLSFLIGIGLFVFTRGIAPLGEALPAIGFHIWIIVTTYLVSRDHVSS